MLLFIACGCNPSNDRHDRKKRNALFKDVTSQFLSKKDAPRITDNGQARCVEEEVGKMPTLCLVDGEPFFLESRVAAPTDSMQVQYLIEVSVEIKNGTFYKTVRDFNGAEKRQDVAAGTDRVYKASCYKVTRSQDGKYQFQYFGSSYIAHELDRNAADETDMIIHWVSNYIKNHDREQDRPFAVDYETQKALEQLNKK